ncbi:hypothetical protein NQ314_003324 [Rhamnusium bicolor]|uniref:D-isomer specific 2-hydroxyacid dehydrogenase NAD-binding domain-containing protein n=1 Tax=Rhamnusium bicolor TaxID=1586634 RepID=A0AAV8ZQP8_9CUCU|nr:hypothetical protein NQ314_003324 [Rhamnusium bicolor]
MRNADKLTKESDFFFVSVPLTAETEGMCNADFFIKMKKQLCLLTPVEEKSLIKKLLLKLKEGQIFAAGLDVMTPNLATN